MSITVFFATQEVGSEKGSLAQDERLGPIKKILE